MYHSHMQRHQKRLFFVLLNKLFNNIGMLRKSYMIKFTSLLHNTLFSEPLSALE